MCKLNASAFFSQYEAFDKEFNEVLLGAVGFLSQLQLDAEPGMFRKHASVFGFQFLSHFFFTLMWLSNIIGVLLFNMASVEVEGRPLRASISEVNCTSNRLESDLILLINANGN